jgi:hypothetical protein
MHSFQKADKGGKWLDISKLPGRRVELERLAVRIALSSFSNGILLDIQVTIVLELNFVSNYLQMLKGSCEPREAPP